MRMSLALLLLAATTASAQRIDPAQFERILFPIAIRGEVPGAFGTRWGTFLMMYNDGPEPALFFGPQCPSEEPSSCQPAQTLHPRRFTFLRWDGEEGAGQMVWVQRSARLSFAAILRDSARAEENSGTELPVVRERDFAERIVLPLVLVRGPFRTALRIYGHDPMPVRIRMYRQDRLEPFVDENVVLTGNDPSAFQVHDIVARWAPLQAAASVRIELESLAPGEKLWAFASQTNNVTQLVTVVRPQ